jgi:hypothetical protein
MSNAQTAAIGGMGQSTLIRIYYTKGVETILKTTFKQMDQSSPEFMREFLRLSDLTVMGKVPTEQDFAELYTKVYEFPTFYGYANLDQLLEQCESLFARFNDYLRNPLSADNGGQANLRATGAAHTSMSVGDIVVIGDAPFIVRGEGFEALPWRVA